MCYPNDNQAGGEIDWLSIVIELGLYVVAAALVAVALGN